MTTQSSTARSAPARHHQPPPGERQLDSFLRADWRAWGGGGRSDFDGEGFAALRFDATPVSVTRTRSFLRSTLTDWQLAELVDDATTVAAELVANAVTHALLPVPPAAPPPDEPTAWIALLRMRDAVVCAVADPSPEPPALTEADPFAESGRGLHIVAELSDTWGHSPPEPAGKTVWARLAGGR
ncbi:ATP-binding protein [Streptomyces sp. NBC_01476]|uniref:ATP-binding protein n=1 Tax=Streptomyces sp. NBC_01476 TaxID=2903881 RepID=UPI002E340129|nr:ATP-binding protein [Streptomyces sp. NBC_01476]